MKIMNRIIAALSAAALLFTVQPVIAKECIKTDIKIYDYNDFNGMQKNSWVAAKNLDEDCTPDVSVKRNENGEEVLSIGTSGIGTENTRMPYVVRTLDNGGVKFVDGKKIAIDVCFRTMTDTESVGTDGRGIRFQMKFNMEEDAAKLSDINYYDSDMDKTVYYSNGCNHLALWQVGEGKLQNFNGKYSSSTTVWEQTKIGNLKLTYNKGDLCRVITVLDAKNNSVDFYAYNLTTGEHAEIKNQELHFLNGDSLKSIAFANFYPMIDNSFDVSSALGESYIDYVKVYEADDISENGETTGDKKVYLNDGFSVISSSFKAAAGFEDTISLLEKKDSDGTTYMRMNAYSSGSGNTNAPYIYMSVNNGEGITFEKDKKICIETKVRADLNGSNSLSDARLQMKYNLTEAASDLGTILNTDSEAPSNHKYYNVAYNDANLWEMIAQTFRVSDGYTTASRQTCMKNLNTPCIKNRWYIIKTMLDPQNNSADYEITDCETGKKIKSENNILYFSLGEKLENICISSFKNPVFNADFDYIKIYEYSDGLQKGNLIENSGFEELSKKNYVSDSASGFYITSEEAYDGVFSACVSDGAYYLPLEVKSGEKYIMSVKWKKKTADSSALSFTIDSQIVDTENDCSDAWNTATAVYTATEDKTIELSTSVSGNGDYYIDNIYFALFEGTNLEIVGNDKLSKGENGRYRLVLTDEYANNIPVDFKDTDWVVAKDSKSVFCDGILTVPENEHLNKILLKVNVNSLGLTASKQIEIYDGVESEIIYTDDEGKVLNNGISKNDVNCQVKLTNNAEVDKNVTVILGLFEDDILESVLGYKTISIVSDGAETVDMGKISGIAGKKLKVFIWDDMKPCTVGEEDYYKNVTDELYIAPWGSDSNDGSFEKPFLTLEAARNKIRSAEIPKGGVTVYIRGGEYKRTGVFSLTSADSGYESYPIVYKAYENEKPVFTQGVELKLSDAKKVTDSSILEKLPDDAAREHLYSIDLSKYGITSLAPADYTGRYTSSVNKWITYYKNKGLTSLDTVPTTPTNEVFYDGSPMTVARYPNGDNWLSIKNPSSVINNGAVPRYWEENMKGSSNYVDEEYRNIEDCFTFKYEDTDTEYMKRWKDAEGALMYGFWYHSWATQTVGIGNVDTENGTITSDIPSYFGLRTTVNDYSKYYVYNLIEELDAEGEYYLDRDNLKLYFYKSDDMSDNKQFCISDGNYSFVSINGAEHVTLEGLKFSVGRGVGISIYSNNVTLKNCNINNISSTAVTAVGENNLIYGCDIENVDGGVSISSSANSYKNGFVHSDSRIENCNIENFSRRNLVYTNAITLSGVGNSAIHNTMSNSYHMAVGISGQDNIFEGNEIYDVCRRATDAAAVYFGRSWTSRGNQVVGNYIHDIHPDPAWAKTYGVNAVFADDNFAGANIIGNIFENIDGWAVKFNGCQDNRLENNLFINCKNRDTLKGGALHAVKTGGLSDRVDILKKECIDQVNSLFSSGYFNDAWQTSEFAKETEEVINNISMTVSAKMNFVAAMSGEEWLKNEKENIKKYINPQWNEKFPEIYEHLKNYAGESQNNTFINNIIINCGEDNISDYLKTDGRLTENNTFYDKSVLAGGDFTSIDYSKTDNGEQTRIRVGSERAGVPGKQAVEEKYGLVAEDNGNTLTAWSNYNPEFAELSTGKDSDGTDYIRMTTVKASDGGNSNPAMFYNLLDNNISFTDEDIITTEIRIRYSVTNEDSAGTGPYIALRNNMPRNITAASSMEVISTDKFGNAATKVYINGHYDLTYAGLSDNNYFYGDGNHKDANGYMSVANMVWVKNTKYKSIDTTTPWIRIIAKTNKKAKSVHYEFYDENENLLLEKDGKMSNYSPDDYLNNTGVAIMNGQRGKATVDVDYLRIYRTANN